VLASGVDLSDATDNSTTQQLNTGTVFNTGGNSGSTESVTRATYRRDSWLPTGTDPVDENGIGFANGTSTVRLPSTR